MSATGIQNRCWNHEQREAVCLCRECRRSFCRECVTEHAARLVCATCLRALARGRETRAGFWHRLMPSMMLISSVLFAWLVFYAAGQAVILIAGRMEQTPSWQER